MFVILLGSDRVFFDVVLQWAFNSVVVERALPVCSPLACLQRSWTRRLARRPTTRKSPARTWGTLRSARETCAPIEIRIAANGKAPPNRRGKSACEQETKLTPDYPLPVGMPD